MASQCVDSVITAGFNTKVNDPHEPPVLDFAALQDNAHRPRSQGSLLVPPDSSNAKSSYQNYAENWISDDECSAPAPPNVLRRNAHGSSKASLYSGPLASKGSSMVKGLDFLSRRRSIDITVNSTPVPAPETPKPRAHSSSRAKNHSSSSSSFSSSSCGTASRTSNSTHASSAAPPTLCSTADSVMSSEYYLSSEHSPTPLIAIQPLPPLQKHSVLDDSEGLSPLLEDDPKSFDLIAPYDNEGCPKQYCLETRSDQLFSKEHLEAILKDTPSLLRFSSFLSIARPKSVPVLIYFLDALKALRALKYANAVAEALEPIPGLEFSKYVPQQSVNTVLEEKAKQALDLLVREDLPAFITHVFIQIVSVSITKRVTGNLPPVLQQASEGLAEVFCLTDPSRTDNPIIFASEEFHRTTQYGVNYAIGRNCRFLQGPKTNRSAITRFKDMIQQGKEHNEVVLNYRRDGSPFMNLLMMAPLLDSRGQLRYFIGAQIDVSGLVKDCADLEAFQHMLDQQDGHEPKDEPKDEFQQLAEMFNHTELDTVRLFGGNMHQECVDEHDSASVRNYQPRLLIKDQSAFDVDKAEKPPSKPDGILLGPYRHYLLVRPAPSLRILFCSPSLRIPGILQSHFLDRIGGGNHVRDSLGKALADGSRGVTAKIRWLPHAVANLESSHEEGRPRWIHCTPLLGQSGTVGVWMIVLVDDEKHPVQVRRFRPAPPVPNDVRSTRQDSHQQQQQPHPSCRLNNPDDDGGIEWYNTQRNASLTSGHAAAARHTAMDYGRQGQGLSPRTMVPCGSINDQRAQRSEASSVVSFRI